MEIQKMKRKELQALCKKYGVPANLKTRELANRLNLVLKKNEKPKTQGQSSSKNLEEMGRENESRVVNRKVKKKVRFSPENQTFIYASPDTDQEINQGKEREARWRRRSSMKRAAKTENSEPSQKIVDRTVRITRSGPKKSDDAELGRVSSPTVGRKRAKKGAKIESSKVEIVHVSDKLLHAVELSDNGQAKGNKGPVKRQLRGREVVVEIRGEVKDGDVAVPRKNLTRRSSKMMRNTKVGDGVVSLDGISESEVLAKEEVELGRVARRSSRNARKDEDSEQLSGDSVKGGIVGRITRSCTQVTGKYSAIESKARSGTEVQVQEREKVLQLQEPSKNLPGNSSRWKSVVPQKEQGKVSGEGPLINNDTRKRSRNAFSEGSSEVEAQVILQKKTEKASLPNDPPRRSRHHTMMQKSRGTCDGGLEINELDERDKQLKQLRGLKRNASAKGDEPGKALKLLKQTVTKDKTTAGLDAGLGKIESVGRTTRFRPRFETKDSAVENETVTETVEVSAGRKKVLLLEEPLKGRDRYASRRKPLKGNVVIDGLLVDKKTRKRLRNTVLNEGFPETEASVEPINQNADASLPRRSRRSTMMLKSTVIPDGDKIHVTAGKSKKLKQLRKPLPEEHLEHEASEMEGKLLVEEPTRRFTRSASKHDPVAATGAISATVIEEQQRKRRKSVLDKETPLSKSSLVFEEPPIEYAGLAVPKAAENKHDTVLNCSKEVPDGSAKKRTVSEKKSMAERRLSSMKVSAKNSDIGEVTDITENLNETLAPGSVKSLGVSTDQEKQISISESLIIIDTQNGMMGNEKEKFHHDDIHVVSEDDMKQKGSGAKKPLSSLKVSAQKSDVEEVTDIAENLDETLSLGSVKSLGVSTDQEKQISISESLISIDKQNVMMGDEEEKLHHGDIHVGDEDAHFCLSLNDDIHVVSEDDMKQKGSGENSGAKKPLSSSKVSVQKSDVEVVTDIAENLDETVSVGSVKSFGVSNDQDEQIYISESLIIIDKQNVMMGDEEEKLHHGDIHVGDGDAHFCLSLNRGDSDHDGVVEATSLQSHSKPDNVVLSEIMSPPDSSSPVCQLDNAGELDNLSWLEKQWITEQSTGTYIHQGSENVDDHVANADKTEDANGMTVPVMHELLHEKQNLEKVEEDDGITEPIVHSSMSEDHLSEADERKGGEKNSQNAYEEAKETGAFEEKLAELEGANRNSEVFLHERVFEDHLNDDNESGDLVRNSENVPEEDIESSALDPSDEVDNTEMQEIISDSHIETAEIVTEDREIQFTSIGHCATRTTPLKPSSAFESQAPGTSNKGLASGELTLQRENDDHDEQGKADNLLDFRKELETDEEPSRGKCTHSKSDFGVDNVDEIDRTSAYEEQNLVELEVANRTAGPISHELVFEDNLGESNGSRGTRRDSMHDSEEAGRLHMHDLSDGKGIAEAANFVQATESSVENITEIQFSISGHCATVTTPFKSSLALEKPVLGISGKVIHHCGLISVDNGDQEEEGNLPEAQNIAESTMLERGNKNHVEMEEYPSQEVEFPGEAISRGETTSSIQWDGKCSQKVGEVETTKENESGEALQDGRASPDVQEEISYEPFEENLRVHGNLFPVLHKSDGQVAEEKASKVSYGNTGDCSVEGKKEAEVSSDSKGGKSFPLEEPSESISKHALEKFNNHKYGVAERNSSTETVEDVPLSENYAMTQNVFHGDGMKRDSNFEQYGHDTKGGNAELLDVELDNHCGSKEVAAQVEGSVPEDVFVEEKNGSMMQLGGFFSMYFDDEIDDVGRELNCNEFIASAKLVSGDGEAADKTENVETMRLNFNVEDRNSDAVGTYIGTSPPVTAEDIGDQLAEEKVTRMHDSSQDDDISGSSEVAVENEAYTAGTERMDILNDVECGTSLSVSQVGPDQEILGCGDASVMIKVSPASASNEGSYANRGDSGEISAEASGTMSQLDEVNIANFDVSELDKSASVASDNCFSMDGKAADSVGIARGYEGNLNFNDTIPLDTPDDFCDYSIEEKDVCVNNSGLGKLNTVCENIGVAVDEDGVATMDRKFGSEKNVDDSSSKLDNKNK